MAATSKYTYVSLKVLEENNIKKIGVQNIKIMTFSDLWF